MGSGEIQLDTDTLDINAGTIITCDNDVTFAINKGIKWDADNYITGNATTDIITYKAATSHDFSNRINVISHWNASTEDYSLSVKPNSYGEHITMGNADFDNNYSVSGISSSVSIPDL